VETTTAPALQRDIDAASQRRRVVYRDSSDLIRSDAKSKGHPDYEVPFDYISRRSSKTIEAIAGGMKTPAARR